MIESKNVGDILYSDPAILRENLRPSTVDSLNAVRDALGLSEDEMTDHLEHTAVVLNDARISGQDSTIVANLINRHIITPPDQTTVQQWQTESRRIIRETYGKQADRRMQLVEEFLDARPAFSEQLEQAGVRSHPRLVAMLAARAYDLRIGPRT